MSDYEDNIAIDEDIDDEDFEDEDESGYESEYESDGEPETVVKPVINYVRVVPANERMMSNVMSLPEYTNIIATRAQQIAMGHTEAPQTFIDNYQEVFDRYTHDREMELAKEELRQKKCPLSIKRPCGGNSNCVEIWEPSEMIIPYLENS